MDTVIDQFPEFIPAKCYIDGDVFDHLPKAEDGDAPVYLVKDLVFKCVGWPGNITRYNQSQKALQLCSKHNYTHLTIPRSIYYQDYIIESRLPIDTHTKLQMGLYVENQHRFTPAVKEFTAFLCQSELGDLTGCKTDRYQSLANNPIARYDNAALYLEGDKGKIGLVDLGQFSTPKECDVYNACVTAIRFFPLHLQEIVEVATRYDSTIDRSSLTGEEAQGKKRIKTAYITHKKFLQAKNISSENPFQPVPVTDERRKAIQAVVAKTLQNPHLPKIVDAVIDFIPTFSREEDLRTLSHQKNNLLGELFSSVFAAGVITLVKDYSTDDSPTTHLATYPELLVKRTLQFSERHPSYLDLLKRITCDSSVAPSKIIELIYRELVQGGEIAYYNPTFGYSPNTTQCIFY